jgi:phosphoribosylformylglycinamidine synthase subunit PurS
VRFDARVEVTLREGIADPEGATIERALPALGFTGFHDVRAGKSFRLSVDAETEAVALQLTQSLADRLLANPVIEQATVELVEA